MHVCLCELFFPGLGLRYIGSCLVVVWLFVWFSYGLYAPIRNLIGLNDNLPAHKIPFHMKFLAGGMSGALAAFVANPTDLLKVSQCAHARVWISMLFFFFFFFFLCDGSSPLTSPTWSLLRLPFSRAFPFLKYHLSRSVFRWMA